MHTFECIQVGNSLSGSVDFESYSSNKDLRVPRVSVLDKNIQNITVENLWVYFYEWNLFSQASSETSWVLTTSWKCTTLVLLDSDTSDQYMLWVLFLKNKNVCVSLMNDCNANKCGKYQGQYRKVYSFFLFQYAVRTLTLSNFEKSHQHLRNFLNQTISSLL